VNAVATTPPIAAGDAGTRAVGLAFTLGLPLAALAWIAAGEPSGPACLMREIAHVDCPTCGMTRAVALITRGDWRASLAVHPWAAVLVLQLFAGWLAGVRWLLRGGLNPERWIPWLVFANGAGLLAVWILRLATGTLPH
jgi:hypothetical protein